MGLGGGKGARERGVRCSKGGHNVPESGSVEETWLWNLESALFVRIDKDVLIMETYQGKGTCREGREES